MELGDLSMLDHISIGADGALSFDATKYTKDWHHYSHNYSLDLDAPPDAITDVLTAWLALQASVDGEYARKREEEAASKAANLLAEQEKRTADVALVDAYIADYAAADPLVDTRQPPATDYRRMVYVARDTDWHYTTEAQATRIGQLNETWTKARTAAKEAAEAAKEDARNAIIAEHGGYWWQPEAGMCDFRGYDLWSAGQTRRWVGIFTQPKGIDSFLDSPRGEHTFHVSQLAAGDCIQGGGYDTNSRGRRRNESEFFAVVIRNDDSGLVVKMCDSRAKTMAAAKKLASVATA
jgi:hypothetical protein